MGIIKQRVEDAFGRLERGDLEGFVTGLVDCADKSVEFQWQRDLMDTAIARCLKRTQKRLRKNGKHKVVVEVSGGVADVTQCPPGVGVEIVDHDILEDPDDTDEAR